MYNTVVTHVLKMQRSATDIGSSRGVSQIRAEQYKSRPRCESSETSYNEAASSRRERDVVDDILGAGSDEQKEVNVVVRVDNDFHPTEVQVEAC